MPGLNEHVADKLKGLPLQPGCYIYRDEEGSVLYVGKAVNLRSRVRSYFQSSARHGPRIARLVSKVREIEIIVVDSELEALVLECNLIKEHRPPFNVRMRDDKSYPYLAITNERFPRLLFVRRPRGGTGRYFGPFTSAWAVRETLGHLHKVFPLIPCGKSWSGEPIQRPCLYYHLGQCLAPCAGLADRTEYLEVIDQVARTLNGKSDDVISALREQMESAAEDLEFEKAAKIRDRLQSMERLLEKQKVMSTDLDDRDIVAVVQDERGASIQMLYVRSGKLIGQQNFMLDGSKEAAPSEAVQEFVKQYYSDAPEVPKEILLPVEIEERQIVESWLRQRSGKSVNVEVPRGGEKLRLVEMAASNAEQALLTMRLEMERKEQMADTALDDLQEALDLPYPPVRIEGYDISNIQGTSPVGSMVVSESAEPAKDQYRRFRIRYHPEDPNDFAMMHEVITRRLRAYLDGDPKFTKLPDLIMIDGGKGQLMAALKARDELKLSIPMVGLAKKLELIYIPVAVQSGESFAEGGVMPAPAPGSNLNEYGDGDFFDETTNTRRFAKEYGGYQPGSPGLYEYREVELPLQSAGLLLLRNLRDEAHRFAISYHRKIRDKRMTGSALEEVPGVGPRRKRLLLRTFGSVAGIRKASVEELAAVPTMTVRLAQQVKDYLADGAS